MRIIKINTTAYKEEDFYLLTNLSEEDIVEVVMPIVNAERDGYEEYDNEYLFSKLTERYPRALIEYYTEYTIDTLTI
jgi:hypothetical protein